MTKSEIEEKINSLESELGELKLDYEKYCLEKNKKQNRWKPKKNENYWYIDIEGNITYDYWEDYDLDNYRYNTNNCFETNTLAHQKFDRMQTEIELRKYVEEHDIGIIDWNDDDQEKFILYYDSKTGEIDVDSVWTMMFPHQIYATNKKVLKDAVEVIGANRLAEYLKGD